MDSETTSNPLTPMQSPMSSQSFCDQSADVVFMSCDNVLFHIHRKNLEVTTGGFPPPGIAHDEGYVELTEDAETLQLLFTFVYPSRHVPFIGADFKIIAKVAEAAEKYEVFCAMHNANAKMRDEMANHPVEVMNYAFRHGYIEMLDTAAPLTLNTPLDKIADTMDTSILAAWLRYYHRWTQIDQEVDFTGHRLTLSNFCPSYEEAIRQLKANVWVKERMNKMMMRTMGEISPCSQWCGISATRYQVGIQKAMDTIPPFSQFIK